jgi:predicted transcriptional regulator
MDPIAALATIVQLLGLYRQENGKRTDLTHQQFMEWLEYHRHEEVKDLISNTFHLSQEVDQLLRADQALILQKLESLNAMMADMMKHVSGWGAIATTIVPNTGLSDDAISLLRYFVETGAKTMVMLPDGKGVQYAEVSKVCNIEDNRFLMDDLSMLERYGLTSSTPAGKFHAYNLTRRGLQFIQMIKSQ